MARIGDMRIAQGKCPLGGFDDTVHRLRVVGIGHLQTVGDAKDRQRHQPLRGWGKIPQRALLVLERQRPRTLARWACRSLRVTGIPSVAIPCARRSASGPR